MVSPSKKATKTSLNGKDWLIGGTWSAGGRYTKKPNMQKTAKEELFDLKNTSSIWLRDSEQVGWFEFSGKPETGNALAPLVLSRLQIDKVPWHGIFRLKDGWWIVAVDDSMALHPLWDVWVSDEDFHQFYESNNSKLMTFPFGIQCETLEETEKWLFNDETIKSNFKVTPIIAFEKTIKKIAFLIIFMGILSVLGYAGYYLWEQHEAEIAHHKKMLMIAQEKINNELLQHQKALTQMQMKREESHIKKVWQDWPRPWQSPISWSTFMHYCGNLSSGLNSENGWELVEVQCTWSPKNPSVINETKKWYRGKFSTVLHLPKGNGKVEKNGNFFLQNKTLKIKWNNSDIEDNLLPDLPIIKNFWLGKLQKWKGLVQIHTGDNSVFLAPIPKGTPPQVAKSLHPPVLWKSFPVTLISNYRIDSLKLLHGKYFIPLKFVNVLGLSNHYIVTGVQYAK